MDENKKDDVVCGHDRIPDSGDFYKRRRGQQKVEAKTKVTYTLKKGTLTIKGKGAMPGEDEISKEQEDQESYH